MSSRAEAEGRGDSAQATSFVKEGGILPLSAQGLREMLETVLARGVPFRFRAGGFSMSPFICDGDIITVWPLAGSRPQPGDILAFVMPQGGTLAVHRLVGQHDDVCLLRGDNLAAGDGPVPAQNLVGRVTRIERNGRPRRLGLGRERAAIAWLSRRGWLVPLLAPCVAAQQWVVGRGRRPKTGPRL